MDNPTKFFTMANAYKGPTHSYNYNSTTASSAHNQNAISLLKKNSSISQR
jgi:hypothetical protein